MFRVSQIMVPIGDCISHTAGAINAQTIERLTSASFDFAPVRCREQVIGLLATNDAISLHESGALVSSDLACLRTDCIDFASDQGALLEVLSHTHAVLVRSRESHISSIVGMVTISDLNRHAFRSAIYPLLAQLEVLLADHLEKVFSHDPWQWLERIEEPRLAPLLGAWELQKRRGIDVSPVVNLNLSQLMNLFAKIPALRASLRGWPKRRISDSASQLTQLRNQIMHPVRTLVLSKDDVQKLRSTLIDVEQLIHALERNI
ncbi:hypothetical protein [Alkalisalibacterium limincola]|uniref:CBS domain-containing protein n=1 Tax=Alkalisalibacterium limincola TaxID=2699169 RepID=A0A5C8KL97_9GAMM|nr:hypothetical protein [Alkalisalibacterium limincola]TXK60999.1 hypothetical protein FU658_10500 [Alkalisalibacterium limincola]